MTSGWPWPTFFARAWIARTDPVGPSPAAAAQVPRCPAAARCAAAQAQGKAGLRRRGCVQDGALSTSTGATPSETSENSHSCPDRTRVRWQQWSKSLLSGGDQQLWARQSATTNYNNRNQRSESKTQRNKLTCRQQSGNQIPAFSVATKQLKHSTPERIKQSVGQQYLTMEPLA